MWQRVCGIVWHCECESAWVCEWQCQWQWHWQWLIASATEEHRACVRQPLWRCWLMWQRVCGIVWHCESVWVCEWQWHWQWLIASATEEHRACV